MSEVYLPLALVTVFAAVVMLGVSLRVSAQGRRPVEALHEQLRHAGVAVQPTGLQQPFSERVLGPAVSGLAGIARRLTPAGSRDRIARKLVLAGSPAGWDAERVLAFKGLALVMGAGFGWLVAGTFHLEGIFRIVAIVFWALFLFLIPGSILGQSAASRQDRLRRSLPDTIDLLTISVEAGLGFDAALLHVRRSITGPLSEELGRMLHEMQLGVARVDSFRHLSERIDIPELRAFVLAMIQADVFGVSISSVLRTQAAEIRTKRRQRAEERAMKVPTKLLFPMLFCILPAMFVVLVAPGVLKIVKNLFESHIF
jgi:tight adherence protein C